MLMIVAIVNQKGGTGKTTTTVNLGATLAQKGRKVLVLDLDAQGNLTYSLGISEFERSVSDVFLGDCALNDILIEREDMDIVPSNVDLADIELSMVSAENRESLLTEILENTTGYDYVLIDCPPSLSLLTINALNAAQKVIIPMQMEVLSLQGLDQIIQTVDRVREAFNPHLEVMGILPVMVDRRKKLSSEVYDLISEEYDFDLFKSQIRTNVRASEAPSFGKSVISYDRFSNSARDYMAFTEEFLKLNES